MWLVYAISAAIVWGLDYSLCEEIFKIKISPVTLLALEMILGGLLMMLFVHRYQLVADVHTLITNRTALWFFIGILITFNLGNLLIFYSIQAGQNATLAALVELAYPIFTIFFSWALFRSNHMTPSVIVGGILIFLGIIVIAYYNNV